MKLALGRCKYCGHEEFEYKQNGPHIGKYCCKCGRWCGWVSKRFAQGQVAKPEHYEPEYIPSDNEPSFIILEDADAN